MIYDFKPLLYACRLAEMQPEELKSLDNLDVFDKDLLLRLANRFKLYADYIQQKVLTRKYYNE